MLVPFDISIAHELRAGAGEGEHARVDALTLASGGRGVTNGSRLCAKPKPARDHVTVWLDPTRLVWSAGSSRLKEPHAPRYCVGEDVGIPKCRWSVVGDFRYLAQYKTLALALSAIPYTCSL